MRKYRIFLVIGGKATTGDKNYMWVKNLYDPLVAMGHQVHLLNIDEYAETQGLAYMSYEAKERLSNDLLGIFLKEHNKKPFEIFFSYLHNGQIYPEVLKDIKKHIYTINYSTNYHQFDMYQEVAKTVDYNIYISKIAKEGFDKLNVQSYWMPLAANPAFYKPSKNKNNEVVFIGSAYGPRSYLFWRLLQYGIDLHLYGHGWMQNDKLINKSNGSNLKTIAKQVIKNATGYEVAKISEKGGGIPLEEQLRRQYHLQIETILSLLRRDYANNLHFPLDDDQYVQTLANAGTVVNIQESRFNHDYYNHQVLFGSNLRDFEATLCGAFVCTQYSSEIEELFEVGKEIICFHNEHDLADKIKYYQKNNGERQQIANAGYARSSEFHTWERRFADFFHFLNL